MKKLWDAWKKVGLFIGNIMSTVILIIFYFTFFALFAIPFRLFSDPLGTKPADRTNLKQKKQLPVTLAWLQKEF